MILWIFPAIGVEFLNEVLGVKKFSDLKNELVRLRVRTFSIVFSVSCVFFVCDFVCVCVLLLFVFTLCGFFVCINSFIFCFRLCSSRMSSL